jgi:hypothetical protein
MPWGTSLPLGLDLDLPRQDQLGSLDGEPFNPDIATQAEGQLGDRREILTEAQRRWAAPAGLLKLQAIPLAHPQLGLNGQRQRWGLGLGSPLGLENQSRLSQAKARLT